MVAGSDKLQRMHITLKDEVAVVTGGSRGIGAATVKVFVAAGAKVIFNYHRANRAAKEVIEACKGLEGQAIAERADVSSMADARRLVEAAVNRFGKLDILVANAGIWNYNPLPIQKVAEKQWDERKQYLSFPFVASLDRRKLPCPYSSWPRPWRRSSQGKS